MRMCPPNTYHWRENFLWQTGHSYFPFSSLMQLASCSNWSSEDLRLYGRARFGVGMFLPSLETSTTSLMTNLGSELDISKCCWTVGTVVDWICCIWVGFVLAINSKNWKIKWWLTQKILYLEDLVAKQAIAGIELGKRCWIRPWLSK